MLLEYRADPNKRFLSQTCIEMACAKGNLDVIPILCSVTMEMPDKAIYEKLSAQNPVFTEILERKNTLSNSLALKIQTAILSNSTANVGGLVSKQTANTKLLIDRRSISLLQFALENEKVNSYQGLLALDAKINSLFDQNTTALINLIKYENEENLIRLLLS